MSLSPLRSMPAARTRPATKRPPWEGAPLTLPRLGAVATLLLLALLVWCLSGCSQDSGLPLRERREATVHAVWFSGEPGKDVRGGVSPITVRVEPNPSGQPAVGVMTEFAQGAGNQWRTSAWMAAFNASQTLGLSISEHEFLVKAGGFVDGPSAGMLTAATMLALLRGVPLREDGTMTGTVNPDGTAGPVGGIPQKMEGAKEEGFTRFGYPIGSRNSLDLRTMQTVDLHEVAQRLGMEVKEIRDLWDAYEFMTGQPLPRSDPLQEAEMELDSGSRSQLSAKMHGWKAEVEREKPTLNRRLREFRSLGVDVGPWLGTLRNAEQLLEEAGTFEAGGQLAAAYSRYAQGVALLRFMNRFLDFLSAVMVLDFDGMMSRVESAHAAANRVEALGMNLEALAGQTTIGGRINAVWGFAAYAQGLAMNRLAADSMSVVSQLIQQHQDGTLERSEEEAFEILLDEMVKALLYYAMADTVVQMAVDLTSIGDEEGSRDVADFQEIEKLASGFASAAGAGVAYFDSLHTETLADAYGLTAGQAQAWLGQQEIEYPILRLAKTISERAEEVTDGPEQASLFKLGFGIYSYVKTAHLVNKYYSLRAVPDGEEIRLSNRKALSYQLDTARRRALEAAARSKERTGLVPVAARMEFQEAAALREGDDEDKLRALNFYWMSTLLSDLAAQLADPSLTSSS